MLKIKQSQVLIAMVNGVGSAAFGIFLFQLTGVVIFGYIASAVALGLGSWILIQNQDNNHTNGYGYANMLIYFLSLVWIALAFHWFLAVLLFAVTVTIGMRYYSNIIGPDTKR